MISSTVRPATPTDCPEVFELIKELAVYEKAPDEVEITVQQLEEDAFGENPVVEILVADKAGKIVGAALTYLKYSTWKGRSLHLEDLVVNQEERGRGIGTQLFKAVINLCKERNYARMEWMVLDWNTDAIGFYDKYRTQYLDGWTDCRLTREQLQKL
jgi:GNAT superfamily N-acetyltransferase